MSMTHEHPPLEVGQVVSWGKPRQVVLDDNKEHFVWQFHGVVAAVKRDKISSDKDRVTVCRDDLSLHHLRRDKLKLVAPERFALLVRSGIIKTLT